MSEKPYIYLSNELAAGKNAVMATFIDCNSADNQITPEKKLLTMENIISNFNNHENGLYQKAQIALDSGNIQWFDVNEKKHCLIEPYYPKPRLVIFGGGHIALPLVEMGARLGFSVTVVDDRPSFANKARFPEADEVICRSFEESIEYLNLNKSSYVIIVTRGHRHDIVCLHASLKYETAYLGMIGSKRRVLNIMDQFLNEGYKEEQLNKVYSPIGLDIGAVTPEEIAVSILAQVISVRRGTKNKKDGETLKRVSCPEFDRLVLDELAKGRVEPKAIVTVIGTKGSTPRKEGAKMIIWPDGRTLGSIGGGCSEGEVITLARDVIKNGGFMIHHIDMTGILAEDEGMVCGGTMEVVIESLI